ncbi:hypothetical protein D3C71_2039820 [compost metagenome]
MQSVIGEGVCVLRTSITLAMGNCGSPSLSPRMRMLPPIRLCSCAVTASPAVTMAKIAARLGLV